MNNFHEKIFLSVVRKLENFGCGLEVFVFIYFMSIILRGSTIFRRDIEIKNNLQLFLQSVRKAIRRSFLENLTYDSQHLAARSKEKSGIALTLEELPRVVGTCAVVEIRSTEATCRLLFLFGIILALALAQFTSQGSSELQNQAAT